MRKSQFSEEQIIGFLKQAEAVQALFRAAGLTAIETRPDLAGQPRITLARQAG